MSKRSVRDAQSALVCAEAFQKLAEELIPRIWTVKEGSYHVTPTQMGDVVACATNLAFAVELYLKGLLTQLDSPVPRTHDLRVLYDALPQPVRTLIESIYDVALPDEMSRLDRRAIFTLANLTFAIRVDPV
jgi:hypothetical protein